MANFSVGIPLEKEIIKKLNNINNGEIKTFYGSSSKINLIGSARESSRLKDLPYEKLKEFVKFIHDCNFEFSYTINAKCLGNNIKKEKIHNFLQSLQDADVDSVIISNTFLLFLIKEKNYSFKIRISTITEINSQRDLEFFRRFKPESVCISTSKNRDFEFLRRIERKDDIELLVNEACLFECPYRADHYNIQGHDGGTCYGNFPYSNCFEEYIKNPAEFLKARWIRPEWIYKYEKLGFKNFKISGRTASEDWIIKITKAYLDRAWNGNLLELFPLVLGDLKYEATGAPIYISNKHPALDEFLEFLINKKNKCEDMCGVYCHFCDNLFRKMMN